MQIGFSKLQRIERGAVKIGNNPRMCFVNTVDWIALTGVSLLVLKLWQL